MNHKYIWFWLAVAFVGMQCTGAKKATMAENVVERSKTQIKKRIDMVDLDLPLFNGRGKVKYDDGDTRVSFNVNIRMRKDSFIWLNASLLGFEVARILVTPDSVFAINRYEKTYVTESYSKFDSIYNIPLTFAQLQEIILGNNLINLNEAFTHNFMTPNYALHQHRDPYLVTHTIDGRYFVPIKIHVQDQHSGYEISSDLKEHKPLDKSRFFSYFRSYIIKKDNVQMAKIQIDYSEVDTKTSKKTPFEIPAHYTASD